MKPHRVPATAKWENFSWMIKKLITRRYSSPASTAVCSGQFAYQVLPFTVTLSDVGGGSVPNNIPNNLARIPLRWMIRESFNANTGIIFDACMLRHELGLDMEGGIRPTRLPPGRLPPTFLDDSSDSKGSFRKILAAIFQGLKAPFHRAKQKLQNFFTRETYEPVTSRFGRTECPSGLEAEEEREDALSPIFDMMRIQPFWKIFEVFPCKFCPTTE